MGPRRKGRGEQRAARASLKKNLGFNGATAQGPWRTTARAPYSRPPATLQWGHGARAVENLLTDVHSLPAFRASMGPRRKGRGELLAQLSRPLAFPGFNGATAQGPWRTARLRGGPVVAGGASMGP